MEAFHFPTILFPKEKLALNIYLAFLPGVISVCKKTAQKGKRTWRLLPPTKWFGINTHPSHSPLLLFRVPFGACLR
jgi:hypothetical protein